MSLKQKPHATNDYPPGGLVAPMGSRGKPWEYANRLIEVLKKAQTPGTPEWSWLANGRCKHITVQIDMRGHSLSIKDSNGKEISISDLEHQYVHKELQVKNSSVASKIMMGEHGPAILDIAHAAVQKHHAAMTGVLRPGETATVGLKPSATPPMPPQGGIGACGYQGPFTDPFIIHKRLPVDNRKWLDEVLAEEDDETSLTKPKEYAPKKETWATTLLRKLMSRGKS